MSGSKGLQKMAKNNVHWDIYLDNDLKCKERKNARITSMNHMLGHLEIHAKPNVEHIHVDTQHKICGHT